MWVTGVQTCALPIFYRVICFCKRRLPISCRPSWWCWMRIKPRYQICSCKFHRKIYTWPALHDIPSLYMVFRYISDRWHVIHTRRCRKEVCSVIKNYSTLLATDGSTHHAVEERVNCWYKTLSRGIVLCKAENSPFDLLYVSISTREITVMIFLVDEYGRVNPVIFFISNF